MDHRPTSIFQNVTYTDFPPHYEHQTFEMFIIKALTKSFVLSKTSLYPEIFTHVSATDDRW